MINIEIIGCVSVLVIVAVAVYFDMTTYKIPNGLNAVGVCGGLVYGAICGGLGGFLNSLLCMVLPVFTLFLLFSLRAVGAGDIKLFSAIGTYVHFKLWRIMALAFILAAVWGAVSVFIRFIVKKKIGFTKMHLSIPIGLATIAVIFTEVVV